MGGTVIDCGFVEVPYPFGFKEVFNPPKRSMGDPDVQLELEAPRTGQFFPFQPIAWFVYSLIQQTLRECGLAVTQGGRSSLKKTFFRSGRTRPHTYLPSKYLPSTYCVPCPGPNPGTPALNSIARSEVDTNSFIPLSRSSLPLRTRISLMQQCPCCLAKGLVHSFGFLNVFTKCSMSGLVVQVLGDLTVTKGGLVTVCEALAVCVLFLCGRGWQITQGGRRQLASSSSGNNIRESANSWCPFRDKKGIYRYPRRLRVRKTLVSILFPSTTSYHISQGT